MNRFLSRPLATAVLVIFPALLLWVMERAGEVNRRYLGKGASLSVSSVAEPYRIWHEKGVKGRILLHFDRRIRADSVTESLKGVVADETYIYRAIAGNMVRMVYHVIPDRNWQEVAENLRAQGATLSGPGFRVVLEGTPVHVVRADGIPRFNEKVLINLNSHSWPAEQSMGVADLLRKKQLESDLITVFGPDAERISERFALLHD